MNDRIKQSLCHLPKLWSAGTGNYLLAAFAATLWGTTGYMGRILNTYGLSALQVATMRAGLAVVALGLLLSIVNRRALRVSARDLLFYALYGLVGVAIFYALYMVAVVRIGVAIATFLLYMAPVYVAIMSVPLFQETLTRDKIFSLGGALLGCAMILLHPESWGKITLATDLLGVGAGLGAGVAYALFTVLGRLALSYRSPWTTLLYSQAWGTLFLLLFLARGALGKSWSNPGIAFWPDLPLVAWGMGACLAVSGTVLANYLYLRALLKAETSRAAVVCSVEPVVATLLATLVLKEPLSWWQLCGGLGLIVAVTYCVAKRPPD